MGLRLVEEMSNQEDHGQRKLMTVQEVSEYLRVHPSTIYRLLKRGGLPGFRVGSDWRFQSEQIDRWLRESQEHGISVRR